MDGRSSRNFSRTSCSASFPRYVKQISVTLRRLSPLRGSASARQSGSDATSLPAMAIEIFCMCGEDTSVNSITMHGQAGAVQLRVNDSSLMQDWRWRWSLVTRTVLRVSRMRYRCSKGANFRTRTVSPSRYLGADPNDVIDHLGR